MITVSRQLKGIIDPARSRLLSISDTHASEKMSPDKWSIKEILGHLTDSAANNHQRIVRMQENRNIGEFRYEQQHWVQAQRHQAKPWPDLVDFWYHYNAHLAHVIAHVNPEALDHLCDMGYSRPATLRFVIEDYVRHLEHHLKQIWDDQDPSQREKWVRREPS